MGNNSTKPKQTLCHGHFFISITAAYGHGEIETWKTMATVEIIWLSKTFLMRLKKLAKEGKRSKVAYFIDETENIIVVGPTDNARVSWSILRASWISLSLIFKDPSMKDGSWDWTSSSFFYLIWSNSWSSSGDGELDLGYSLYVTRYSYSFLW